MDTRRALLWCRVRHVGRLQSSCGLRAADVALHVFVRDQTLSLP